MNPLLPPSGSFFSMTMSITLILILAPKSAFSVDDERYVNCSRTLTCGNIDNIGYPFWGSDRPEYCGFPGFQLNNCSGTAPAITIELAIYQVLRISSESRVLTVATTNYAAPFCAALLPNTSLSPVFEFSSDTQDTFLYHGCPYIPDHTMGLFELTCGNSNNHLYYGTRNLSSFPASVSVSFGACYPTSILPANQSEIQYIESTQIVSSMSPQKLDEILAKGFGLQWKANNSLCDGCKKSGGQCGYNLYSNTFSCYCVDQPYDTACPSNGTTASKPRHAISSSDKRSRHSISSSDKRSRHAISPDKRSSNQKLKLIIGVAVPIATILGVSFMMLLSKLKKKSLSNLKTLNSSQIRKMKKNDKRVEEFILECGNSLGPQKFSYSDIKKITNSFSDKLGQGGYGSVYKGTLLDGRIVAVKVLNKSEGDGQDFINEVASISRTSHVNIVTLLGFCYQRSKRALIYEYMPNGSLDKFIYNQGSPEKSHQLDIKILYEIAVGIAQGLEYLHKGCNTRILHFDIKPHNILLDRSFCPKISDFGLAKLCETRDSIVSITGGARGTCGYIAPEMICRNFGGVSYKSDVYSYGMMVLEMIGARKKGNAEVSHSSEMYFPSWIYKQIQKSEKLNLDRVTDDEEEEEMTRKMVTVSLWCIQTIPSNRPSMSKVLEMFQGSLEALPLPPEPLLSSPGLAVRSPQNSSTTSSVIMQVVSEHL